MSEEQNKVIADVVEDVLDARAKRAEQQDAESQRNATLKDIRLRITNMEKTASNRHVAIRNAIGWPGCKCSLFNQISLTLSLLIVFFVIGLVPFFALAHKQYTSSLLIEEIHNNTVLAVDNQKLAMNELNQLLEQTRIIVQNGTQGQHAQPANDYSVISAIAMVFLYQILHLIMFALTYFQGIVFLRYVNRILGGGDKKFEKRNQEDYCESEDNETFAPFERWQSVINGIGSFREFWSLGFGILSIFFILRVTAFYEVVPRLVVRISCAIELVCLFGYMGYYAKYCKPTYFERIYFSSNAAQYVDELQKKYKIGTTRADIAQFLISYVE